MKTGITFGTFDLLHPGHVAMLEEAKQQCDYLIVGLHTDPSIERTWKNKPVQSTFERFIQLEACKFVDEVIPYDSEEDLLHILMIKKPQVRIIGEEYCDKDFTGRNLPYIITYYNTRPHSYSSTELRQRVKNA